MSSTCLQLQASAPLPSCGLTWLVRAGLLCLKQAKEGGLSSFSSSVTVINEMLRQGRWASPRAGPCTAWRLLAASLSIGQGPLSLHSCGCFALVAAAEPLKQGPLLRRRDLVEELAGAQWWLDRKGEVPAGSQPFFRLPILHYHQASLQRAPAGCLACSSHSWPINCQQPGPDVG